MEWLRAETMRLPFAAAPTAAAQVAAGALRFSEMLETVAQALLVRRPLVQLLLATALAAVEAGLDLAAVLAATVAADIAFWFLIINNINSLQLRFARQLIRRRFRDDAWSFLVSFQCFYDFSHNKNP